MMRPTFFRIASQAGARRAFSSTTPRPLARITIIGNLAATPELVATSTGREIIRYTVVSNSGPRDESGDRNASFFRVTSFTPEGPLRDFVTGLPKGSLVCVEGDASMSTYQDAEGKNRTSLNIVQRSIEALRRPANESTEGSG